MSLCVIVASCSQDDLGVKQNGTLPEGKFPLKLTASVEGMVSRAGETDYWADGDQIRVCIGNDEKLYPWIGNYSLNPNGYVKEAIEALAWPYQDGYVSAWFPYFENNMDVSISNQSKGYHRFDFMKARTDGPVNYTDVVSLNFKHQMAKVGCILFKGEGITDEDLETAEVSYYGFTEVKFSEEEFKGDVNGWITPTSDFSALLVPQDMSGKEFIEVKITLKVNGVSIPKTLTYTPETGQGELKAGSSYTYKITVQKDRLEAQTITGQWIDDKGPVDADQVLRHVNLPSGHDQTLIFSTNVTPVYSDTRAGNEPDYLLVKGRQFSISYELNGDNHMKGFFPPVEDANNLTMSCVKTGNRYTYTYKLDVDTASLVYDDYVQVGDIYYSDGTWSHGRLDDKTPIGVVFRTGAANTDPSNDPGAIDIPTNYGWDRERLIRGYVVALKDASTVKGCWANDQSGSAPKLSYHYVGKSFSQHG